jgi:hypothetical protein
MKQNPPLPLPDALLDRMEATAQNPRYHREGSVLAHTQYVLQQCLAMQERFDLDENDRQVLYWASVLHDVGKTVTSVWQDNRWRSPGHEKAGLPLAMEILLQQPDVSTDNRRKILDLVRWHGMPLKFSQWQKPLEELKLLGTRTDLRLLAIFGLFDFYGRDCDDRVEVLARMHEFQEISVPQAEFELGQYDELQQIFEGWNLRHKNAAWNAVAMRDVRLLEKLFASTRQAEDLETRNQTATMVIGAPLSGKSAWIAANHPDRFCIDLAEHGVVNDLSNNSYEFGRKMVEFKHFLRVYLNRYQHLMLETRHLNEPIRRQVAVILRDMPVRLEYVLIQAGLGTIQSRNLLTPSPLPEDELGRAYSQMELIHPWEAHRISYVSAEG